MKWLPVLLLALFSTATLADAKEDKARKLFKIQGVERSWQSSIDESRIEERKQAKEMLDQMMTQINPDKTYKARMAKAMDKYVETLQTKRTAKDILNVLIPIYASKFTESELDKMIEFYGSPVGRKDAEVSNNAMKEAAEQFEEKNQKIRTAATNQFVQDIQRIATECNCSRTK